MRLKLLHLENFRKHADSVFAFGDASFIVIRGKNFAGKSTVGQAISMTLTPSTAGLAADGRGFVSKIKKGAQKAVITADIQGRRNLIQRTVTLNTNSTGRTQRSICLGSLDGSGPEWNPAKFDEQLEENRAALTVTLNSDAFLRMDAGEQKNLLARLALPVRYDFDPAIMGTVERMLPGVISFKDEPFAVINSAYEKLFNERTIANRQVRDFQMPEPPAAIALDSRSLEEQLNALREERRKRVQERDKAVAEATAHQLTRVRAKSRIDTLDEALSGAKARAEALKAKLLPPDKLGSLHKVAEGRAELTRLEKEHEQAWALINGDINLSGQLSQEFVGGRCPTCDQPFDQEKLTQARAGATRRVVEGREAAARIDQRIRALGDVGTATALIAGHEKTAAELAAAQAAVEEKQRQLEQERSGLPEAAEFDFQPYDKTVAECDVELERLAGLLRPAIAAEERGKEIAVKKRQLEGLKERAAALDVLVKYFDKDGIKAKLLKQYVGGFELKINETLKAWGYSCALLMEPYSFDVTNADGDTVPVRELSGAERVMFSLAFQCAVARTANIGLVVIDEVAMFLPELRTVMNRRVYEMVQSGELEQAILLVADSAEQVPKLPGAAFFMVDHGMVRELKP
jgi:DNA repair exonuclease SbcCD ATPase subunit